MKAIESGWIASRFFAIRCEAGEKGFYSYTGKCWYHGVLYKVNGTIEIKP